MKPFWVTTSWDDGHRLDLRIAERLEHYGLVGTFYISKNWINERLPEAAITQLATRHEIGAHTINHSVLTQVSLDVARQEIVDSKSWLEQVTGRAVTAFCYPKGKYNQAVRDLVIEAGYQTARSVDEYRLDMHGVDRFALPTTIHVYPFPLRPTPGWRPSVQPLRRLLPHITSLRLSPAALRSWPALAAALLARAAAVGGVWHLWGHSWEIERYGMWDGLDTVLAAVRRYPQARMVSNAQLAGLSMKASE